MSESFIKRPEGGPLSALADTGVLRSHMEALNTRLAAEQPVVPLRLPVSADEWNCHATTTIRDASGEVLAECSGHGRHSVEDEAVAAEIVRRVNVHEELVEAATAVAAFIGGPKDRFGRPEPSANDEMRTARELVRDLAVKYGVPGQNTYLDQCAAVLQAAIARATGAAA